jgi:hypothetical protein
MGDFKYPRSFGFTGSADRAEGRVAVKPHTRQRFAKGGRVRPKTPAGKIVGGLLAAGAAAAGYDKLKDSKPEPAERRYSTTELVGGKGRRQREQDLGLKRGGKVKRMKDC